MADHVQIDCGIIPDKVAVQAGLVLGTDPHALFGNLFGIENHRVWRIFRGVLGVDMRAENDIQAVPVEAVFAQRRLIACEPCFFDDIFSGLEQCHRMDVTRRL
ncbi:MAG: hypothetical protein ACO273_12060 [Burkholderiales bacterium]